ncbi:MAG TPA: hypothetical protein IAB40_02635 [Candidatus Onthocola stercoravium]|nr:hypothetical protein [Candidatus Onthocola stercoravium]
MNYEELLNIPYKPWKLLITMTIIIIICGLIIINIEIYDVYNTYAYYKEGNIVLNIPINYSDTILNGEYFKIDDEKSDLEVLYVSDILIDTDTLVNYQEVIVASSKNYPENLIINISIYYNKEKVLDKIKKLL